MTLARDAHPSPGLMRRLRRAWREFTPHESIDGPSVRHFRARQIQAVLALLPLMAVGHGVNTAAVVWMFSEELPLPWLLGWGALVTLALVLAWFWWRRLMGESCRPVAQARSVWVMGGQVATFTVLWSVLPIWIFPGSDQHGAMLIVAVAVAVGMICGGAFMLSPVVPVALIFLLGMAMATLWGLLRSAYVDTPALLIMLVVYCVVMVGIIGTNGRMFLSRLRAEAEAERQKQLIDLLLRDFEERASDWLWEISSTGHLRHVSARLAESFGLAQKQLLQRSFLELLSVMAPRGEAQAQQALARLQSHLRLGQPFRDLEIPVEVHDEVRWWALSAKPLLDENGRAAGWRGVGSDVTQARKAREDMARLANFDALTGLANRHRFSLELARCSVQATDQGRPCALLFVDLDNFKTINDSLGHSVGDQLLRRVGARLQACASEGDLLARLGGDEFALLTWQHAEPAAVAQLAARMLSVLSEPCQLDDVLVDVQASIGVALAPRDGRDPQALLQCADLALYAAKAAGRNTYRFFHADMAETAKARARLQHELGMALAAEQFTLFFQPQMHLETGDVIGFEALVRWQHSERGLIAPGEFIPVAEETGQIVPLGNWVLREACKAASQWPGHLRVAVNLSAMQFRSASLIELVESALADSGLAPERLELEITESVLINDDDGDGAQATLMALRSRGIRVAMDDFGTGYSSLAYLRRFPLDKLKIDGMFVRSLDSDTDAQAVVTAIVSLAKALRLETTAEGIETAEQLVMLRALGCDDVQGYLIARPMPAVEVVPYLKRTHLAAA